MKQKLLKNQFLINSKKKKNRSIRHSATNPKSPAVISDWGGITYDGLPDQTEMFNSLLGYDNYIINQIC